MRLTAEKLTSKVSIQTSPVNAELALDGVSLGRGLWSGKLRPGKHRVEIAADGFVLQVRDLDLRDGQQEKIETTLERDPLSPLWKDNRGRFFVEGSLGPMFVPTLGGDVASCTECSALPGFGVSVQARGGYRFPSGFVVGVDAGFSRETPPSPPTSTTTPAPVASLANRRQTTPPNPSLDWASWPSGCAAADAPSPTTPP
ncbi:MAG TPA: PEGA domain-containing protein [Polyangium sp.]|nr:PEGA domain-containing protein [Polyangium sp.]